MSITNVTSTKVMLMKDNYNIWLPDMEMVLQINGVIEYIDKRLLKTLQKDEIPENKRNNHIKVRNTHILYYEEQVTEEMIRKDATAKYLISNSISEEMKTKIDFRRNTAYDIWKIIMEGNNKSDEEKKNELNNQLEALIYQKDSDISLFIAELDRIFGELYVLGEELSEEKKYNILYFSLPYETIIETNIISTKKKYTESCNLLKTTIPYIKYLKEESKIKQRNKAAVILNTTKVNNRTQHKSKEYNRCNNKNNNNKENRKCLICGKIGHIAKNCWHNRKNKNNKGNNRTHANNAINKKSETYCEFTDSINDLRDYDTDDEGESSSAMAPRPKYY